MDKSGEQERRRVVLYISPDIWRDLEQIVQAKGYGAVEGAAYDALGAGIAELQRDARAWAEDEKDMAQIAREWRDYDRDPPGS